MADITFNIYGGTQQVNPNATSAVQNFYGDKFGEQVLREKVEDSLQSDEAKQLSIYINKGEDLRGYLTMLASCITAKQIGDVVAVMLSKEERLTHEEVDKARFISLLPPLAPKAIKGLSVDNLRIHIDNAIKAMKSAAKLNKGL